MAWQKKRKAAAKKARKLATVLKVAEDKVAVAKARGIAIPSPPAYHEPVPQGYR